MVASRTAVALATGIFALGCQSTSELRSNETQEIIDNLLLAGFPAADITVAAGTVYVGRDAEVSLIASREMLRADESSDEQFRTNNLVSTAVTRICIDDRGTFGGVHRAALELAMENYNQQGLRFTMTRAVAGGCSFTINAVLQPGLNGGFAGFPSGGLPFGTITIGDSISPATFDVIEHVITHELGHTIGFRHSDFYNRSISCGVGGDEGDAGIGAIFIPGTDPQATPGSSLMNSCFSAASTGEFTASDVSALRALYPGTCDDNQCQQLCASRGFCEGVCVNNNCTCRFRRPGCP